MGAHRHKLILLATICIIIASCKLDKPVLPGDPGYVKIIKSTDTVTGNVIEGAYVSNPNLTGTWKAQTTSAQYYDKNNVMVSNSPLASNLFTTVTLNDYSRIADFAGPSGAFNTTYSLSSTTGKDLYLQLSADPFSRSSNSQIQVVNLTATSMTWLAIDPALVSAGGQMLHNAYLVTFTK
jgi:hypothetical protein